MPEIIELPEQDHTHHEDGRRRGHAEEGDCLGILLVCTEIVDIDIAGDGAALLLLGDPAAQLVQQEIAGKTLIGIGAHHQDALAVAAIDRVHTGTRFP